MQLAAVRVVMKISGKAHLDNKSSRSAVPSPAAKLTVPSFELCQSFYELAECQHIVIK
jgi:hypothetical protein